MQIDWREVVGTSATLTTIAVFLTGIQICYKIRANGSCGDISSLPFLTTFANCVIMFFYGLLVDDLILIIVNAVGFTLEAVYLVFYLFYTQSKKKLIHQVIFIVISISILYGYAFHFNSPATSANIVGTIGSIVSVVMFGAPLTSIRSVIKSQSTESLSFPLCFANLSCASLWTIYGFIIGDKIVVIPNLLGSMLGFAQVSLFFKFPSVSSVTRTKLKVRDLTLESKDVM